MQTLLREGEFDYGPQDPTTTMLAKVAWVMAAAAAAQDQGWQFTAPPIEAPPRATVHTTTTSAWLTEAMPSVARMICTISLAVGTGCTVEFTSTPSAANCGSVLPHAL